MLGFADEVWWSRFAQPHLHTWTTGGPLRLVTQDRLPGDPDPAALACFGLLRTDTRQMLLRFVAGRPISTSTIAFLEWLLEELRRAGKKALLLVWDNAPWHCSRAVRTWLRTYNRTARKSGDIRLLICHLPIRSPWLNPIEPRWVHGKRAIHEPSRTLSPQEVKERVCAYYQCELLEPLAHHQP